jgi:hypothetical protein
MLNGTWLWVYNRRPVHSGLNGFTGAIVRAANGNGVHTASGFDYSELYARWAHAYTPARCAAWTWLYGPSEVGGGSHTDGYLAATAIAESAPQAPSYLADIEHDVPAAEIAKFTSRLRELKPGVPLGFTSWPTEHQASTYHVPWTALVEHFDFGAPQVYEGYQGDLIETVIHDHHQKPLNVIFRPDRWPGWQACASAMLQRFGGFSIWSFPVRQSWRTAIEEIAAHAATTD